MFSAHLQDLRLARWCQCMESGIFFLPHMLIFDMSFSFTKHLNPHHNVFAEEIVLVDRSRIYEDPAADERHIDDFNDAIEQDVSVGKFNDPEDLRLSRLNAILDETFSIDSPPPDSGKKKKPKKKKMKKDMSKPLPTVCDRPAYPKADSVSASPWKPSTHPVGGSPARCSTPGEASGRHRRREYATRRACCPSRRCIRVGGPLERQEYAMACCK